MSGQAAHAPSDRTELRKDSPSFVEIQETGTVLRPTGSQGLRSLHRRSDADGCRPRIDHPTAPRRTPPSSRHIAPARDLLQCAGSSVAHQFVSKQKPLQGARQAVAQNRNRTADGKLAGAGLQLTDHIAPRGREGAAQKKKWMDCDRRRPKTVRRRPGRATALERDSGTFCYCSQPSRLQAASRMT